MMVSALIERELTRVGAPVRNGVFVAVVGPSGAGKDTLIAYVRERLTDDDHVEFARRVITRNSDGATEDHDTLADAAFVDAEASGAFALSWEAHGLRYGIPASVDDAISVGHVVVANTSRGVIPALRARYAHVAVVEITAAPEVLATRLAARGRESRGEVLARLARTAPHDLSGPGHALIDNSGTPEIAGEKFLAVLRRSVAYSDVSGLV
ncbi:ribose 1,5-bisphosphokinase [Aminobacter niigataensis]|uniref:Ribose 1,5-bisphosphate phosphokinase PhnN n=1 Tax=Aminobacter niigataensis TaxID=83265 RepID=A0ABR6L4V0_9HYPH|nr:phosphonate metabolism protein/1,5-bisphosphokinase (PRPP-forming) PhnN [Aminobacter niigataensis]MBB4651209.1 ribose 1,5-bisphosphokinase [Aminobacter niigataensis]